jgi:fucose permease
MLPATMSVQVTSIFAGCLAVGRLLAGVVMRRLNWYPVLTVCMLAMGATVLLSLPLTHGIAHDPNVTWATAPVAAFLFPLIGLFMAPIYPGINSVMLSSLPRHQHAPMTGLLVIFSALGGTTGSLITGYVFGHVNAFRVLPDARADRADGPEPVRFQAAGGQDARSPRPTQS